ncbi:MAG: oxaloacetate decarboxylase subunit alpha [Planctomycetales bacterium 4484_113]|nr:MAG: oxaloacetate decarboxylase subunit alpha [Planctomycetales bacterium 4484_113]
MSNPLKITDLILRDAHQSLIATRMRTEHMLPIAPKLDSQPYYSFEMWGGATFDSCIRFCGEDPWERLRKLREALPNSRMQMLLRGQNILGYRHYPDDVVERFVDLAAANGIDIFRIFDALNDTRNMRTAIQRVKKRGKHVQAAVSYTTSPVHTLELWRQLSKELAEMGADSICIKDMAGLLEPRDVRPLLRAIRDVVDLPIQLHCHYTSGLASICYAEAIDEGVDIVDTDISSFSTGTAHPPTESIVALVRGTERDTGLDLKVLNDIASYFREVRLEYKEFESPFSGVNPNVLVFQIPGGMISNLAKQLKDQKALDRFDEVVEEVPKVREDMGYPPLVTPTSQIVGSQAVFNVLAGERYKIVTEETKSYLKGMYGKPPGPVNEEIRKAVLGEEEPITCRPADKLEPEFEKLKEEIKDMARSDEDVLTYALFPQAGREFLEKRNSGTLAPVLEKKPEEKMPAATPAAAPSPAAPVGPLQFKVSVGEKRFDVVVEQVGDGVEVQNVQPASAASGNQTASHGPATGAPTAVVEKSEDLSVISAPVLGKVLRIVREPGDAVSKGETVLVLEAMKMENELASPVDGTVVQILVQVGQDVDPGAELATIREQ